MSDAAVWVDGMYATDLAEISHDPSDLDRPGWWAVVGEFEGRWHLARFETVTPATTLASIRRASPWTWSGAWGSSLNREEYCEAVEAVRRVISNGGVYQANICRLLQADCHEDLLGLALLLESRHNAPFAAWMRLPEIEVVSASPERYLERAEDAILSSPIKGTAVTADQLLEKDRAENIMIVDLVRHDLGQVCVTGSVQTPRLLAEESHPGLVHLVSDVQGQLTSGASWSQILEATFPPGSVSGAPKLAALDLIRQLEPTGRGPYCGAVGWVSGNQGRLAVGIRTFYRRSSDSALCFGVGSGITWESDPEREWDETVLKASKLIALAGGSWS